MSIASPTLRSSSSTVPGPSLRSSATSMRERPSTAETCTGTSNTASRSAAALLTVSMSAAVARSGRMATSPPPSRSGSGTLASLSLIARPLLSFERAAARGRVAVDHLADGGLGRRAVTHHAAVGPFDAAVAGRDVGLRQHDQAPREPVRARRLLELLARLRVQRVAD